MGKYNKVPGRIINSAAIRITSPKKRGSVKIIMGLTKKKKTYSKGVTILLQRVGVNMTTVC